VDRLLGAHLGPKVGKDYPNWGYAPSSLEAGTKLFEGAALGPSDVLFDVGAGRGKVALLALALTGCKKVVAVERSEAMADHLRKAADRLGLSERLEVVLGDATEQDYSRSTAFYFFNPFVGEVMKKVSAQLQAVVQDHPVRVLSYGHDFNGWSNRELGYLVVIRESPP
jgi:SAM-dependent methyltransferase